MGEPSDAGDLIVQDALTGADDPRGVGVLVGADELTGVRELTGVGDGVDDLAATPDLADLDSRGDDAALDGPGPPEMRAADVTDLDAVAFAPAGPPPGE